MPNELIEFNALKPMELFTTNGLDALLSNIEKKIADEKRGRDISTDKGRKAIASFAFEIARSKTALDKLGKDSVAGLKEQVKVVDRERSRAWDHLEALQKDYRAPLTEWEEKQKSRIAGHELAIAEIQNVLPFLSENAAVAEIETSLKRIDEMCSRESEEFGERAKQTYQAVGRALTVKLHARQQYDKDQAELARLRKESEDREKKEREDRIAKEASLKAQEEAEEKIKAAKEQEEKSRREKAEADERARRAEEYRIASEKKAESDRVAAAKKAEEEKQAAADAATLREQQRQQDPRRKEKEAEEAREADKKHRSHIHNHAMASISVAIALAAPEVRASLVDKISDAIIDCIAAGQVPHIKINY